MGTYKTVPNQKVVKVNKEKCDKAHLYATINLDAMEAAAQELKAGAFKLWVYFAKNQNNYEFALSNKEVLDTFGIKKDQYDSAIKELKDKGYLVEEGGNRFSFSETAVVVKNHNEKNSVVGKTHNTVVVKNHNAQQEKPITGCGKKPQEILQDITDNTIDNTEGVANLAFGCASAKVSNSCNGQEKKEKAAAAEILTREEAVSKYGLSACVNRVSSAIPGCYWIDGNLVKLV